MGSVKKLLSKINLPPRESHNSRMFVDLAENIHIHHREYRQVFNLDEFFEYTEILRKSESDVRQYLTNNPEYEENKYPTTLMIAGGKERQLKFLENSPNPKKSFYMDEDMAIELQEEFVTDEIHIHYRDFRISMDRSRFKLFSNCVSQALKNLEEYEKDNEYNRKSHSDRLINDFNNHNKKLHRNNGVMGVKLIESKSIKSKFYEDIKRDFKPNKSYINILEKKLKSDKFLTPIILSKKEDDIYFIIDGHHRFYTYLKNNINLIHAVILNVYHKDTEDLREGINSITNFDLKTNYEYYLSDYLKHYLSYKLNKFYKDDYSRNIKRNTFIYIILRKIKYLIFGKERIFKDFFEKHNK